MSLTDENRGKLRTIIRLAKEVLGDTNPKIEGGVWRKLPPTDDQIRILREKGFSTDGLNRGMASDILDNFFRRRKRGGGSGSGSATSGNSSH
jgi:hypothetical protein